MLTNLDKMCRNHILVIMVSFSVECYNIEGSRSAAFPTGSIPQGSLRNGFCVTNFPRGTRAVPGWWGPALFGSPHLVSCHIILKLHTHPRWSLLGLGMWHALLPLNTHYSFYLEPSFSATVVTGPPVSLLIPIYLSLRSLFRCNFLGWFVLMFLVGLEKKVLGCSTVFNND